jgi:RNA polymerase sigma factor (TIGR02999 family)
MLREWGDGNAGALETLMPLVYDELRKQAGRFLRKERPGHTLQTTALINETYLKLVDKREANWASRTHFFAISARLMRRILIDHARRKHRDKRGGSAAIKITLDESAVIPEKEQNVDLIALDQALDRLSAIDDQQARVVELRYFSGLSLEDTATALNVSRTTVVNDWRMARAWLHRELTR